METLQLSAAPGDRDDETDEEEPRSGASKSNGGDDGKGPVEVASALEDESGDSGSDDSSEITDEVLEAGPTAGGEGSGESLRDGPEIGRGNAEKDDAEDE